MGNNADRVSVLMSVYAKETAANLDQCLESLAAQTLPAAEMVIVKDGRLMPELERRLAARQDRLPLKIVGYEENRGLAYALNYGLRFYTRELIAHVDSDDICLPGRFEKQMAYFEKNSDAAVLGGGTIEFYGE